MLVNTTGDKTVLCLLVCQVKMM